jgi:osmotically-inducible protein OsmY
MTVQKSTMKMHQGVFALTGLMAIFAATFAMAIVRVSQTEKFAGQPFHSQTCESKVQSGDRKVISWRSTCRLITVQPLPKTPKK